MTTIVIGLDGANWTLLDEWIEDGELPNLGQLIESGVGGRSRSCLPPLTVPNWKCYSTGKNPGKLDVFRFDKIDTEAREHVFHDATDFKSAELWDYLNQEGYTAGVINKPSTYPPKSIDGFVVAGGPDASESEYRSLGSGFASPDDAEDYLREELDYQVHPKPMISPSEKGEEEVEAVLDLISLRFEAADRLLDREDPDFLHLTVFYSMALQHYFWRDEPVYRAWQQIDEEIGRFLDKGHDIIVMSDHGTCYVDAVFYINVWLVENGYLSVDRSIDETLRTLGFTRERALSVAKRLGIVELLSTVVPERVQRIVPWEEGVKRDRILSVIDWEETKAVASNQGPIYLSADDKEEYELLRDELIEELESVAHPETKDPLVRGVYRGEEYYSGEYAENAPDLLLDQANGVHTSDAIGPESWYSSSGVWKGGNMPEGVFLMSGPSFEDRGLTEEARIVDLAPTILHSMGVSVPGDMDGEVLDVFDEGSIGSERSVETQPPLGADRTAEDRSTDDVEQRLEDLGYLE
ncbi:alkaline phosphatase family protein [Halostagnicola sp. A-GB9-2]|uniref:alkaline phosphatase family protein n=1 Tax=Halostagnicola sp. A-GB9-2 TaxID=3048066 RepID=UPI0024C0579B|nr:alkaline phosphatase family protein [Halostagnicola sp. A-GB9-2]MDJ1434181.1 alkaline phosphatase family protein [Halostagnicola sp. A-GB9-2]